MRRLADSAFYATGGGGGVGLHAFGNINKLANFGGFTALVQIGRVRR